MKCQIAEKEGWALSYATLTIKACPGKEIIRSLAFMTLAAACLPADRQ